MSAEEMFRGFKVAVGKDRFVGRFTTPPIHEALGIEGLVALFKAHGMELSGAPLSGKWSVDSEGRITQIA